MYRKKDDFEPPSPPARYFPYIDKVRRLPAERYLTMPFAKQPYDITEGWFYSLEENGIHGMNGHTAVDFQLPLGADVLAAAPGWAMASYMRIPVFHKDGNARQHKGKRVEIGYGYFVQVYHGHRRFTLYGHLSEISKIIPYFPPRQHSNSFLPPNLGISSILPFMPPRLIEKLPWFARVERGDVIGKVGDSGSCWDYSDFPDRPNREEYPSWDEAHLHLEELSRFPFTGRKILIRDPYDIYKRGNAYPDTKNPKNIEQMGPKSLWILDNSGWPKFVE